MKRLLLSIYLACLSLFVLPFASAAELTLGPGDIVKISVYNNPDLGLETRIGDSGNITFPLIGQVQVGGLTVPSAERKISEALDKGGFIKRAQVNIIVTSILSQQVSVLGQVNRPGRYPLDARRSLLDVLALAGGFGPEAGDTLNLIRNRDGQVSKQVIDVVEMVRKGDLNKDVELAANDVIYVERSPRFYVYGEVQRPGSFRLERSMTVLQALAVGGGLTPRGTERGMIIKRRDANGNLQMIEAKKDELLQNDDILYIKESWF
ncbi:polysaccharide export protein EpsE [Massilia sp. METH4]|uniref:polysaccharide export protein EpsE n=1 Tax=Massilia sp. METH4 TaxID=3123041 RepID=UPI0030D4602E